MPKKRRSHPRRSRQKESVTVPPPRPGAATCWGAPTAAGPAMRIQPRQVPDRAPADGFHPEPLTGSRGEASCDFVIPSASVPAVRMGFGDLYAEQRRRPIVDGFGFTVELPAVIDLLASVEAGTVTAGAVRELFLEAAAQLYRPLGCVHAESEADVMASCLAQDGCALCEYHRDRFEALLDECDELWERLGLPQQYPFAVSRQGVHTASCHVVRRETPEFYARPTGSSYLDALREYSHSVDRHGDRWDFEGSRRYPRIQALDIHETDAWIAEHTGPRGGVYYKPCRRCSPAL
ncbi:hypothetical protein ACIQM4_33445 [Streptomyces sp. NPDC091272]|uniref:hypothetical protein n=1 Tax=Streptomyces sp. NPDC091272 TaxID=3365981 RepID=UPI003819ADCF